MKLEFFVPGVPRPQGSKRHLGNGVMVESCKHVKDTLQPKDNAPREVTNKPDLDKIVRAVLDACTGVVWRDDAQVYWVEAEKVYGPRPGVDVTVCTLMKD